MGMPCPAVRGARRRAALVLLLLPLALTFASSQCPAACICTPDAHPSRLLVNCTLGPQQTLDVTEGALPTNTGQLSFYGGQAVTLGIGSLSKLRELYHVSLDRVSSVLVSKHAAQTLDVNALYLEVRNCGFLHIKPEAFVNIKGPLTLEVSDCNAMHLERAALSWALAVRVSRVPSLELGADAFSLDTKAANVRERGATLTVELRNVVVPELATRAFGSSAARILLEQAEVHIIRTSAFSANTYHDVTARHCSFHLVESGAFHAGSFIEFLTLHNTTVHRLFSDALLSAVQNLNFTHSRFEKLDRGAINTTVVSVTMVGNEFKLLSSRAIELSSWDRLLMKSNSFDELESDALLLTAGETVHELTFERNELESAASNSLRFVGNAWKLYPTSLHYSANYFGRPCSCDGDKWLPEILAAPALDPFAAESFCTVDQLIARCLNVPDQNMVFSKFLKNICTNDSSITCEPFKAAARGEATEIKNPRFPHKHIQDDGLSDRNKKVIGIVIVTVAGCIIVGLFISSVRWMRRNGYCANVKTFLVTSNASCGSLCGRICGSNAGLANAGSISQMSINEYSERHCLNEPRSQDAVRETILPDMYTEHLAPTDDKMTQTLPEELTKELLEDLKEKLEDPKDYLEAREMIEHLYELIKVEESCNASTPTPRKPQENIYDLPFTNTAPRLGKNKRPMKSVGTGTPSLEHLAPLSPYNRRTALAHEYFEPKDFAVHLYAEIANSGRKMGGAMPDVVEPSPRGPYLRAVLGPSAGSMQRRPLPAAPSSPGPSVALG